MNVTLFCIKNCSKSTDPCFGEVEVSKEHVCLLHSHHLWFSVVSYDEITVGQDGISLFKFSHWFFPHIVATDSHIMKCVFLIVHMSLQIYRSHIKAVLWLDFFFFCVCVCVCPVLWIHMTKILLVTIFWDPTLFNENISTIPGT